MLIRKSIVTTLMGLIALTTSTVIAQSRLDYGLQVAPEPLMPLDAAAADAQGFQEVDRNYAQTWCHAAKTVLRRSATFVLQH